MLARYCTPRTLLSSSDGDNLVLAGSVLSHEVASPWEESLRLLLGDRSKLAIPETCTPTPILRSDASTEGPRVEHRAFASGEEVNDHLTKELPGQFLPVPFVLHHSFATQSNATCSNKRGACCCLSRDRACCRQPAHQIAKRLTTSYCSYEAQSCVSSACTPCREGHIAQQLCQRLDRARASPCDESHVTAIAAL